MRDGKGVIRSKELLSADIYKLVIEIPDIAAGVQAGQFVHLQVPGFSLRRPFTVADAENGKITLIIRSQGRGTAALAAAKPGTELQVLGPLGRGFIPQPGFPLLLGGGIGAAALTLLAKGLPQCTLVMGARNTKDLWLDKLKFPAGVEVQFVSDDGSRGFHGNLVQFAEKHLEAGMWVAACGPQPMLAGLQKLLRERNIPGQFALEQRMACGLGACMGCACQTKGGPALVCKDGPVFSAQEVVFS